MFGAIWTQTGPKFHGVFDPLADSLVLRLFFTERAIELGNGQVSVKEENTVSPQVA